MTDAVDEAVMMPLIDEETGIVDSTVQAVTEYLFATHGNIYDGFVQQVESTHSLTQSPPSALRSMATTTRMMTGDAREEEDEEDATMIEDVTIALVRTL